MSQQDFLFLTGSGKLPRCVLSIYAYGRRE